MTGQGRQALFAGLCVLAFLATQTFQQVALWLWIPGPLNLRDELVTYALPVDQVRAILVPVGLILLIVPYCVVALRYNRPQVPDWKAQRDAQPLGIAPSGGRSIIQSVSSSNLKKKCLADINRRYNVFARDSRFRAILTRSR
jgi:hypothetical protein